MMGGVGRNQRSVSMMGVGGGVGRNQKLITWGILQKGLAGTKKGSP